MARLQVLLPLITVMAKLHNEGIAPPRVRHALDAPGGWLAVPCLSAPPCLAIIEIDLKFYISEPLPVPPEILHVFYM
jgi:hypothetical protein